MANSNGLGDERGFLDAVRHLGTPDELAEDFTHLRTPQATWWVMFKSMILTISRDAFSLLRCLALLILPGYLINVPFLPLMSGMFKSMDKGYFVYFFRPSYTWLFYHPELSLAGLGVLTALAVLPTWLEREPEQMFSTPLVRDLAMHRNWLYLGIMFYPLFLQVPFQFALQTIDVLGG